MAKGVCAIQFLFLFCFLPTSFLIVLLIGDAIISSSVSEKHQIKESRAVPHSFLCAAAASCLYCPPPHTQWAFVNQHTDNNSQRHLFCSSLFGGLCLVYWLLPHLSLCVLFCVPLSKRERASKETTTTNIRRRKDKYSTVYCAIRIYIYKK